MTLYLLRHADAAFTDIGDASRPLTTKGVNQAERIGRFLKDNTLAPGLILTSPLLRAKQTASIVAARCGVPDPVDQPWLACGMHSEDALAQLPDYAALPSLMLVGHEPDLGLLTAFLLGMQSQGNVHFRKACLVAIDFERPGRGTGVLEWMLPARFV